MKRHSLRWIFVALFIGVTTVFAWKTKFAAGLAVWAEWKPNAWYHGTIAESCAEGWLFHFDDGDKKCCPAADIAADTIPAAGDVRKGSKVVAEWTDMRYYPGKISAVSGDSYSIQFEDGDKRDVDISKIRLRGP
ncbi:MAG: DUF4537 domain-containing protein [Turneriella sp.]|nr:DUF4537 domain-containing protein [Turneriella sp.]